jgi:hypothetical protein
VSFTNQLSQELTSAGISGRLRRRIVAEIADHLACDPEADLGEPRELARQFADQLGTSRARRAAVASFGALALAGILFAAALVASPHAVFGAAPPGAQVLGRVATGLALLAPQIAFVAGVLAALRAVQRRRRAVLPAAEATVIVRRAALGVAAGIATMVGLGLIAVEYRAHVPGWWATLAEVSAAVGIAALVAAIPSVAAAARLRPVAPGPAGDVFDDLGAWAPASLRGRPWRLAFITAAAVAAGITFFGVLGSDAYDGAVRGILDALLCLLGFATLGRYLGLWSPEPS